MEEEAALSPGAGREAASKRERAASVNAGQLQKCGCRVRWVHSGDQATQLVRYCSEVQGWCAPLCPGVPAQHGAVGDHETALGQPQVGSADYIERHVTP